MKKLCLSSVLALLTLFCFAVNNAAGCTTFCMTNNGEVLFGKNYDWAIGDGVVFVNKRGVEKTSLPESGGKPAKWISKYGSVTFNQYGRENPSGGMNEAGLVIELMWLDETEYPKADARPVLGTLEWIQYQLDNSASVDEVIKSTDEIRIGSEIPLHYLVSDKPGNTATVEFLGGRLVAHRDDKLPVPTLTNDTYEKSLTYSKATPVEKAKSEGSLDRFARAAQRTAEFRKNPKSEQDAVKFAFETLSSVAQTGATQWSIVYDLKRGKVYFRTLQNPQIKMFEMKSFDYTCASPVKIFDLNSNESGDVTAKFSDYTRTANRNLIEVAFGGTDFLKGIPAQTKDLLASYPESFTCKSR